MARTPKISTAGKLHSAEKDIWMIIMQKLADAVQARPINPKELLRTAAEDALAYYNKAAGTQHTPPKIILFSNFKESSEMDKSVLNSMDKIGAGGTYIFNKVYLDDRELWAERPTQDGIEVTKRSLSHEIAHYIRDKTGARNHLLAMIFRKSMGTAIRTLEEGCAVFVDGIYHSGEGAGLPNIVKTVYDDPGIQALAVLPDLYDIVSNTNRKSVCRSGSPGLGYKAISRIINDHQMISSIMNGHQAHPDRDRWFYTTGTNLAMIVYAADDFNTEKTVKKLLTLNYDGFLEELKQAIRPGTKEAIRHICNSANA